MPVDSLTRFWSKVYTRGPIIGHMESRCWQWVAGRNAGGYGIVRGPWSSTLAHRVSLEISGVRVVGFVVRHRCDNPSCVRPSHLITGNRRDNVRDSKERGRWPIKVPAASVEAIRVRAAAGEMQRQLAQEFGVSEATISRFVNGHKRKDCGGPIKGK